MFARWSPPITPRTPFERFCRLALVCSCSLFLPSAATSFLFLSSFLLSLLPSRYLLLRLAACEPNENTRAEKGKSEDDAARASLVAPALRGHEECRRAPTSAAHTSGEGDGEGEGPWSWPSRLRAATRTLIEPRRYARRRSAGRRRTRSNDSEAHGARGTH